MSQWTHPICDRCWNERNPDRVPFTLRIPDPERCCFCGEATDAGIYVRHDPATAPAHLPHESE